MFDTLTAFIDKVNKGDCECVTEIIRIKNSFSGVLNWKSFKDCQYVDLKLNVIVHDKDRNVSIVGEVQWLLKWLLKAKK